MLRIIIGVLTFIIGITAVMLISKVNPFRHSHSRCAERSWNPPPPAPVKPVATHACAMKSVVDAALINAPVAPDEPPPPPPPPSMNNTDRGHAQPRAR